MTYRGVRNNQISQWLDVMNIKQRWLFPFTEMPPDGPAALRTILRKPKINFELTPWSSHEDTRRLENQFRGYFCFAKAVDIFSKKLHLPDHDDASGDAWTYFAADDVLNGDTNFLSCANACYDLDVYGVFRRLTRWCVYGDKETRSLARSILRVHMYAIPLFCTDKTLYLIRW